MNWIWESQFIWIHKIADLFRITLIKKKMSIWLAIMFLKNLVNFHYRIFIAISEVDFRMMFSCNDNFDRWTNNKEWNEKIHAIFYIFVFICYAWSCSNKIFESIQINIHVSNQINRKIYYYKMLCYGLTYLYTFE